jgi:hypothetical protein
MRNHDPARAAASPETSSRPAAPRRARARRGLAFQLAAVGLVVVSALAGTGLARWLRVPTIDPPRPPDEKKFPGRILAGWPKPALVLVLSGQQIGYLLPCGCSRPQVGGLERRYNFIQALHKADWPVAAFDLGDVAQRTGVAGLPNNQWLIKYRYSMQALDRMGYSAVGIGENEAALSLIDALAEHAVQPDARAKVVSANLMDREEKFPKMTHPWRLVEPAGAKLKVGVTSVTSPTVAEAIKKLAKVPFSMTPAALDEVLKEMAAQKVDLRVLLYQGPTTRNKMQRPPTEGVACAEAYPHFPLVVCLSEDSDALLRPITVTTRTGSKSWVLTLGKKGKYVGVVGVYRTGKANQPFEFRYERVEMTEDFLTPDGQDKGHPILELMESYTAELKARRYLSGPEHGVHQRKHELQMQDPVPGLRNPGKDGDPVYVGSQACKRCHEDAYDIWKKTPHSHAYKTLVDAKRPSNRQYDPECIVCHTVGFGYHSGFVGEKETPKLKDVGCESCHGPASLHARNPQDKEWRKRINPWKYLPEKKRKDATDQFCQKCHDEDNDVTWTHGGFDKKWPKIAHPNP